MHVKKYQEKLQNHTKYIFYNLTSRQVGKEVRDFSANKKRSCNFSVNWKRSS